MSVSRTRVPRERTAASSSRNAPPPVVARKSLPPPEPNVPARQRVPRTTAPDSTITPRVRQRTPRTTAPPQIQEVVEGDDDGSTVLVDSDFAVDVYPPQYDSVSEVVYRIPDTERTIGFVRCPHTNCGRVISDMAARFSEEVDNAQRKSLREKQRGMTTEEYNEFVGTTYDRYGNIFEKGALDRVATIYDTDTRRAIDSYKKEFQEKNQRRMTVEEYNDYVDGLDKSKTQYSFFMETTKEAYREHFGTRMQAWQFDAYTGHGETTMANTARAISNEYRSDLSDAEYMNLVDSHVPETVSTMEAEFLKGYGRKIMGWMTREQTDILDTVVKSNSTLLMKECCRMNIARRIIIHQGRDATDRGIKERGVMRGNVVEERLEKPIPYRPYEFEEQVKVHEMDMEFPIMPAITDNFVREEEDASYNREEPEQVARFKVYTGIPGMETYRVTGRKVRAI